MNREAFIKNLESLLRARRSAKSSGKLFSSMHACDVAVGSRWAARDAANVAHYEARVAFLDREINHAIARAIAPTVEVFARYTPATCEEPSESFHEIECPICRDTRAVEYADGLPTVACGECGTIFRATSPELIGISAEQVAEIVIESLPEIAGVGFLGGVPR